MIVHDIILRTWTHVPLPDACNPGVSFNCVLFYLFIYFYFFDEK